MEQSESFSLNTFPFRSSSQSTKITCYVLYEIIYRNMMLKKAKRSKVAVVQKFNKRNLITKTLKGFYAYIRLLASITKNINVLLKRYCRSIANDTFIVK